MNKPTNSLAHDNTDAFSKRCAAYRERHGDWALSVFLDVASSELFVVKSNTGEEVTLTSVQTKSERVCPESDLHKSLVFAPWVWDEMVFYAGTEDQQAAQRKLQDAVVETIKACLARDEAATS